MGGTRFHSASETIAIEISLFVNASVMPLARGIFPGRIDAPELVDLVNNFGGISMPDQPEKGSHHRLEYWPESFVVFASRCSTFYGYRFNSTCRPNLMVTRGRKPGSPSMAYSV